MRAHKTNTVTLAAAVFAITTLSLDAAVAADAKTSLSIQIGPQPLEAALVELSKQGHLQLVIATGSLPTKMSEPLHGSMPLGVALDRLLKDTGLTYKLVGDHTIAIVKSDSPSSPGATGTTKPNVEDGKAGQDAGKKNAVKGDQSVNHRSLMLRLATILGICVSAAIQGPVCAQDASATEPESGALEEILVTAQRRSEDIQKVPVSVAAFSETTLQNLEIVKVQDLQQVDPSLSLSAQSGAVIPFIRGIGNIASQTPGNESSVPIYIDDAYYSRLFVPYLSFADDIERVEVLKGPQGTLFGRNATGGLISIVTRDPGQTPEFDVRVGYGSQQTTKGQLYVAGPIANNLAADFSIIGQKQNEGFGRNLYNGDRTYFRDFYTLRSKVVWTPTDSTKIRLSGIYVYDNSSIGTVGGGGFPGTTRGLPPGFTQPFPQPSGFFDIDVNYNTERHHRGRAYTLKIDQSLGFADFSSISFWRNSHEPWTSEGDHTYVPWLQYNLNVEDREATQEFQLKSKPSSPFTWILGLYYLHANAAYDPTSIMGDAIELGGLSAVVYVGKQQIDSKAIYTQETFPLLSDQSHLTLGARYTIDNVEGFGENYGFASDTGQEESLAPNYYNDAKFNKITYKTSFDHSFTDTVMAYTSYSRGYKSGVFNLLPLDAPPVPPEVVDAYEIGLKQTFAERRVTLDTAAFWDNIEHLQTNVVDVVNGIATVQLANADKARTRGIEASSDMLVLQGLTARVSGQYIDARFIDFPNAPYVTPIYTPPYGLLPGVGNVSGYRLPQIPRWKLNVGLEYQIERSSGKWLFGTNVSYRDAFPWEADNVAKSPPLTLVNANITFTPSFDDRMSVYLWSKNLMDVHYFSNVLSQTGPAGFLTSPDEGRTYGVELGYKF